MGFGSYDESEHEKRQGTTEMDDREVDPHDEGHGGEFSYEMDGSTDDMLDQLKDIKESADETDDE